MNLVSFVFQDSFLFFDTLYENIRVGNTSATREQVIEAARAAQCHDFIESLPDGYHTRIGDKGVYLSGGESNGFVWQEPFLKMLRFWCLTRRLLLPIRRLNIRCSKPFSNFDAKIKTWSSYCSQTFVHHFSRTDTCPERRQARTKRTSRSAEQNGRCI